MFIYHNKCSRCFDVRAFSPGRKGRRSKPSAWAGPFSHTHTSNVTSCLKKKHACSNHSVDFFTGAWNVNSLYPKVKMSRSQAAAANRYLLVCQVRGQFVHDLRDSTSIPMVRSPPNSKLRKASARICPVEGAAVMLVLVARTQMHFCATISNLKTSKWNIV